MNKNTTKIKDGIRTLAARSHEVISGTVVAGSIDEAALTISVLPSDDSAPIGNVMLNSITGSDNGLVLFPKEGSNVVIGSVDGSGEWILLRASELTKMSVNISSVKYAMDETQVSIQNGNTVFNVSSSLFKVTTASESLYQILKDTLTEITKLTVTASGSTSSIPINASNFIAITTRLDNLLTP